MKKLLPLLLILLLPACVTDPVTGKKSLSPDVQNAMIDVAKAAAAGIASSAASGNLNWAAVAQGALSQVYSTTTLAAANHAIALTIPDAKLSTAVQTAVGSVVATAKDKGLNTTDAVVIGATFLDNELENLKK